VQEEPPTLAGDGQPEADAVTTQPAAASQTTSSSMQHIRSLIKELSPPPKSVTPRVRKRKAESAVLITGSPFKKMLEEKEEKTTAKKTKNVHKEAHVRSKRSKGTGEKEATAEIRRKSKVGQGRKLSCKKVGYSKMHESATKPVTCMCGIQENTAKDLKFNVGWIACNNCGKWLHETCAELGGVLDDEYFYCDSCID